jgi:type VI secretion system protein ImpE
MASRAPNMDAASYLKEGLLQESLASLMDAIREKPEDHSLRVFLFQLAAVLGQWDRCLTQLRLVETMNPQTEWLGKAFQQVVQAEFVRSQVFAGKVAPLLFGEPEEWMGWFIQALKLSNEGHLAEAKALRERALESAPANPGSINGRAFEWMMDADARLGPFLEVIVGGTYYWAPFSRIRHVRSQEPNNLRDLVWMPASFTWSNGGEMPGHIPVRYAGTESQANNELKLARRTDWISQADGSQIGMGQRLLATENEDVPLLELRNLEFAAPPGADQPCPT